MGQKVNPNGFRIGITKVWPSSWFAKGKKYRNLFLEDVKIRRFLDEKLPDAGIAQIFIERDKRTSITIHTSKPGVIIGKQGANIENLKKQLAEEFTGPFEINIQEVRSPDTEAENIAEAIQQQIQRRMPYRRAAKMAIEKAMQAGAKGIKVQVSGRLNGADIARNELFKEGNIPLQTLRADVTYARRDALTMYGIIGVKVWIYKGMVFKKIKQVQSASSLLDSSKA
jgi:small subunit ribosomal protein S3